MLIDSHIHNSVTCHMIKESDETATWSCYLVILIFFLRFLLCIY